ncbi:MAG TPA: GDSL-type esterase/lipase family protein [Terriglobales bacterium]|nr:GDSL-type esterase/lipase family protein [Terriglobales bacterium]
MPAPKEMHAETAASPLQESRTARASSSPWRLALFVAALLAVIFNRRIAPTIHQDWLNFIPLLGTLYLGYSVIAPDKVFAGAGFVAKRLAAEGKPGKPFGSFLLSPWFRSLVLIPLLFVTVEFGLRMASYHRALLYERQGDLLFTPVPNQEYTEKASLTSSKIDELGLRGGPVNLASNSIKILALGDSITYGYGVDDDHTYPARLQMDLDSRFPGQYTVLNGGVDAYPISFEHQKFLYLWQKGVHPEIVIVGYSFNEGGLGHLMGSDARTKDQFAARVRFKNAVRSIALYNLVVENWARRDYDKMKKYMVPGTNFTTLSQEDVNVVYTRQLDDFAADLRAHGVKPVFLLFCGYDRRTGNYDDSGPFQKLFSDYARKNGIPLVRSKEALLKGEQPDADLRPYFQDPSHMKPPGTQKVADMLTDSLPGVLQQAQVTTEAATSAP